MNLDSDPDPDRDNFRMIRNRYLEQRERRFANTVNTFASSVRPPLISALIVTENTEIIKCAEKKEYQMIFAWYS